MADVAASATEDIDLSDLPVNTGKRSPPIQTLIFFLISGLLIVACPIYLYVFIYEYEVQKNVTAFGGVSIVAAVIMTYGYSLFAERLTKTKQSELKSEREAFIKEKITQFQQKEKANKGNLNEKKKQIENKFTDIIAIWAAGDAVLYNNILFIPIAVLVGFYLFKFNVPQPVDYAASVIISAVAVALLRTPKKD